MSIAAVAFKYNSFRCDIMDVDCRIKYCSSRPGNRLVFIGGKYSKGHKPCKKQKKKFRGGCLESKAQIKLFETVL